MAVFTTITSDEAAAWVRLHFGIDNTKALSPIAEGIENTNYLLHTATNRYILTIFELWNRRMTEYYAALMRHLSANGAPAPAPLHPLTAAGGQWHDKPALLTPFIEGGEQQNPNTKECEKMGAAIAKLHMAAADFMQQLPNPRNDIWRRQTVNKLRPLVSPDTWEILQSAIADDAAFAQLPLPAAACHCDLFRNNVLWNNGEIAGIIDFYFGGDDTLIFDLAVCACDWCVLPDSGKFHPERLSALLRGYENRRPLCDLERVHFCDALRTAALRFWISRLADWHFPRAAKILAPHDPRHFENIYRCARDYAPPGATQ